MKEEKIGGETSEPRKGKNVNELLTKENFRDLAEDDLETLLEADEEYHRRGHFERIFPNADNVAYYWGFFETIRYNNLLLWKWLKSKSDYLGLVFKKAYHTSV